MPTAINPQPPTSGDHGSHWWDYLFHGFGHQDFGEELGKFQASQRVASTPTASTSSTPVQRAAPTGGQALAVPGNQPNGFDLNNQKEQGYLQKNYNYSIWTGETRSQPLNRYGEQAINIPKPTSAMDYMQQWQSSTDIAAIASLQHRLVNATLLSPQGLAYGSWDPATEKALAEAMAWSASHPTDPSATVDAYINQRIAFNMKNGLIPGTGTQTYTINSTHTDYNLTDPEAAKGLLTSALEQYLGRMPNDAEVAAFTSALNSQEQAHPQITKTKSTRVTNPGQGRTAYDQEKTSSSVTSGGYGGQAQYAADYARSQPGSAEYQAASMMQALDQMLAGPRGPSGG